MFWELNHTLEIIFDTHICDLLSNTAELHQASDWFYWGSQAALDAT